MSFRPPSPGVLVDGKYRLAERIGGGGMGDVYRAEHTVTGRPVAIKFLHPELAQNDDLAQRFFQEAQAVNRIRHPNVVDVIDAAKGELGPYIVMEYLDGESVGTVLSRVGRFEVEAAVATAIPVLEALDAAHRVGIVHRDLKPENVFLAFGDSNRSSVMVRLLDFGIAKMLDAQGPSPRTRTGVVFGTPDYLSPEQATGDVPLDGRSDLFAVGVLIYELLTGTRPFRAPTAVATAFKVVHAEAPSISAAGVHVEPRLEATVQRLLQKDPAKRFPVASDVVRELDRVSTDPARRANALFRVLSQTSRRLGGSGHDSDRSASREPLIRRPPPPDLGAATQPTSRPHSIQSFPSRVPELPSRLHEAPKSPRVPPPPSDLPKTVRSLTNPDSSSEVHSSRPTLMRRTPARPFPQRFVGRFQVRGPVLRSVDKVVTEMFGAEARDEVVSQMPDAYAADFRNDSINALVAYELEALDAYMEYASRIMLIEPSKWREIGRQAVEGELYNVVRTLLRPTVDVGSVIRRGVAIWARLFSFGAWRVTSLPNGKVALNIAEFDAVAQPLRQWVIGVVEQTARRAVRADVRVSIQQGDQEFTPELTCEIG